jgi:predicted dehydrogenase
MSLKTVVLGCGYIGQQHLGALVSHGARKTTVACDLSAALAQSSVERFGLSHWSTDFQQLLKEFRPDIVHIGTPAHTHVALATQALRAGAHVFVEKPIALRYEHFQSLAETARSHDRILMEDHNYRFNPPVRRLCQWIDSGQFGRVTHVEVFIALDILGEGSAFTDRNVPHPSTREPGGAIADFLTHLSYLACQFIGPHRSLDVIWKKLDPIHRLPADEFRAMIQGATATACLGFSAHTQPDAFWLTVQGTKMSARANLFESRLTVNKLRAGIRPLTPLINGLAEGGGVIRSSLGSMKSKVAGAAGSYQGLWDLVGLTHQAIKSGQPPPVSLEEIDDANRLVADIQATAVGLSGGPC